MLLGTLGFLAADGDGSRLVRRQPTVLEHVHGLGIGIRICCVVLHWAYPHIALIQQILLIGYISRYHLHMGVQNFTGKAMHHQGFLALEQSFPGVLLQTLVQLQGELDTVATVRALQLIAHKFTDKVAVH